MNSSPVMLSGANVLELTVTNNYAGIDFIELIPIALASKIEAEFTNNRINNIAPGPGYVQNVAKHSGGKSVMIGVADKLVFAPFTATPGTYKIRTWVRTGSFNASLTYDNPTSYTTNYKFKLNADATPLALTVDPNNVYVREEFYGRSYWGIMNSSTITLTESSVLELTVTNNYAGIDYIELIPVIGSGASAGARQVTSDEVSVRSGNEIIYPNPGSDRVTVFLPGETSNAMITIIDGLGNNIYSSEVKIKDEKGELDVREVPQGVFIIQINSSHYLNHRVRFIKK
jgi:hypothetical protein